MADAAGGHAIGKRSGWLGRAAGWLPAATPGFRIGRRMTRPVARKVNLALQGGGAHGAFTWGVLDRLLETEVRYEGISGTSAGAINAVVFASGWLTGGPVGARANLTELWRQVAGMARPLRHSQLPPFILSAIAQLLSPYQLNPLRINPLRELLERLVDFDRLRRDRSLELAIAATNVRSGAVRIFQNHELSPDAVLASACLPQLHHAIEIEGEAYWDGGYSSNPPLLPLVERCRTRDLLLVRINASARGALPTSAGEIRDRIGEIVFDQPLERELALLAARRGGRTALGLAGRRLARHRLHVIDGGDALSALDPTTRLVPDWTTLQHIHHLGRGAAASWLGEAAGSARPATKRRPGRILPAA